jgi:hypothetical protein
MTDEESEVTEPKQDRIGNDYHEGPNPNPGGEVDTGGSLVPPYKDRSGESESASQDAAAESVRRQGAGEDAPEEANPESLVGPTGGSPGKEPPKGTGESINRRGEDVAKREGKEPGRLETGTDETGRPTAESTPRDKTGVNPQAGPDR